MIVTDKNKLITPCEPCSSVEEGEEIGVKLLKELGDKGVGLAANQIGINKRVCVVNVKEPIVLVNPVIETKSPELFAFAEGCLSFPNDGVTTIRHKHLTITADNHTGKLHFGVWNENNEDGYNKEDKLNYALETACVQHEIDHLDGITMYDREYKPQPLLRKKDKIGRNQKVTIQKNNESKTMKFKKAQPFLRDGWELLEI
jgi:peptide deformylase